MAGQDAADDKVHLHVQYVCAMCYLCVRAEASVVVAEWGRC